MNSPTWRLIASMIGRGVFLYAALLLAAFLALTGFSQRTWRGG